MGFKDLFKKKTNLKDNFLLDKQKKQEVKDRMHMKLINSSSSGERGIWEHAIERTSGLSFKETKTIEKEIITYFEQEKIKEAEKEIKEAQERAIKVKEKKNNYIKIAKYLENFVKNFEVKNLETIPIDFIEDIAKRLEIVKNRMNNHNLQFISGELANLQTIRLKLDSFNELKESIRINLLIMQSYPILINKNIIYSSDNIINYEQVFKGYYELFNLLQDNKIQNLYNLIIKKDNLNLAKTDLIRMLIQFSKNKRKIFLEDKLKKITGSGIKDIAISVYSLFGENFEQDMEYICGYLNQKNKENFTSIDLKIEIENIKDNRKLSRFEEELFNGSNNIVKRIKIEDVDKMSGYHFEEFCRELFEKKGYKATKTKSTGDQGADVILEKDGEKIAVQSKRYSKGVVGNKAVQEVVASLKYYNCNRGMIITNNHFTKSARDLGLKNKINLIDREKLIKMLED